MCCSRAVFVAIESGLCSFSDRHSSFSACLEVFTPNPHPTAFFIHGSSSSLDILILPRKDRCPYGTCSLKAAVPCCAHHQSCFLQWHGLVEKALHLKHNHHQSSRLLQREPSPCKSMHDVLWVKLSLGNPCSCAAEFLFGAIPEHPLRAGRTTNLQRILMPRQMKSFSRLKVNSGETTVCRRDRAGEAKDIAILPGLGIRRELKCLDMPSAAPRLGGNFLSDSKSATV